MHAVYGSPPAALAFVAADAVAVCPTVPGALDLATMAPTSLSALTMVAPRGKLERRFAIAQGLVALKANAPFAVLALKNNGGNRLAEELASFGCSVQQSARQHYRICSGVRPDHLTAIDAALSDGALQFVDAIGMWSQPGVFCWDRIDPGSAVLLDHLPALSGRGADFGCGIGVLTSAVLLQAEVQHITAIDIDRRAVEAAGRNIDQTRADIVWADIRESTDLPVGLDFVISNPPFHDGGREDQDLGRLFIKRAAEVLRPGGLSLIVANRHLPYEAALATQFSHVSRPIHADGYKVYKAIR